MKGFLTKKEIFIINEQLCSHFLEDFFAPILFESGEIDFAPPVESFDYKILLPNRKEVIMSYA